MANLEENSFSSYALTEDEQIEGAKLTITQRQLLQNHLAGCSEEFMMLEYDVDSMHDFIQKSSYQQGMIAAYKFLIDSSDAAHSLITNEALATANAERDDKPYENVFIDESKI